MSEILISRWQRSPVSTNPSIDDVESFCQMLLASELFTAAALEDLRTRFVEFVAPQSKFGASLTAFTTFLVARESLTCWQCAKLRTGKFQGFFLDGYKLLDHLSVEDSYSRFLAEDPSSGDCVVLCIYPPWHTPLQDGKPSFWVEDFVP